MLPSAASRAGEGGAITVKFDPTTPKWRLLRLVSGPSGKEQRRVSQGSFAKAMKDANEPGDYQADAVGCVGAFKDISAPHWPT